MLVLMEVKRCGPSGSIASDPASLTLLPLRGGWRWIAFDGSSSA
ncbi:MAG: hypothetical protein ACO2OZ_06605 [Acidilobaceae archaeon]